MATNSLQDVLAQTEGVPATIGNNLVKLWRGASSIPQNLWQLAQHPGPYASQLANRMLDNSRENIMQLHQAFGDPSQPWVIADPDAAVRGGMAGVGFAPAGLEAELADRRAAMGGEDVAARFMRPSALDLFRELDPVEEADAAPLSATLGRAAKDTAGHLGEKTVHHAFEPPEDPDQVKGNKNRVEAAWRQILGAL